MIIANPIYDVVFRRLMGDDRIPKFFISTLLNETVEDLRPNPQEYAIDDETIRSMVEILRYASPNRQQKKEIEDEQEAYRILNLAVQEKTEELKAQIKQAQAELSEKAKAFEEKNRAIEEKDKPLEEMAKQLEALKQNIAGRG